MAWQTAAVRGRRSATEVRMADKKRPKGKAPAKAQKKVRKAAVKPAKPKAAVKSAPATKAVAKKLPARRGVVATDAERIVWPPPPPWRGGIMVGPSPVAAKWICNLLFTNDFKLTFSAPAPVFPLRPGTVTVDLDPTAHDHDADYAAIATVNAIGGRVTALEGSKCVLTIKRDIVIDGTAFPTYPLAALTCAWDAIGISVSGTLGAAGSTEIGDWLRFTWSVDATKLLRLRVWTQAGAEVKPDDLGFQGKTMHLEIIAVG
jgi:hypothetical protein